jgi:hypothetical protein
MLGVLFIFVLMADMFKLQWARTITVAAELRVKQGMRYKGQT